MKAYKSVRSNSCKNKWKHRITNLMFFVENLSSHCSLPGWLYFLAFDQLVRCWMRMKLFQDVLLCSVTLRNILLSRLLRFPLVCCMVTVFYIFCACLSWRDDDTASKRDRRPWLFSINLPWNLFFVISFSNSRRYSNSKDVLRGFLPRRNLYRE